MKRKSIRKMFNITALLAFGFILTQAVGCGPSVDEVKEIAHNQALQFQVSLARSHAEADAYISSKVVRIHSEHGMCSGEQVHAPSGADYILTASHCKLLMNAEGTYSITTEDGKHLERRLIAEDPNSDLLLLEGLPNVQGLDIGDDLHSGEGVWAYTHGHNHDTYKSAGQALETLEVPIPLFGLADDAEAAAKCHMPKYKDMQLDSVSGAMRVCILDTFETVTTASIAPGSSGGPVVDSEGHLVGVVSAGDNSGFGFLVSLKDVKAFLSGY